MKLTYSILWFDDDEDYIDSVDLEPIEEAIRSWGFEPNIVMVSEPAQFMGYEPFHEFDLIAVDYNLEACGEHGETFIQNLRQHGVYTEVIFYSANKLSDLWDAVRNKELEGVFIASRASGGEQTKIINVAKQSIHKFLDLNNIRGVIMAEVGTIDEQLDLIATHFFKELDTAQRQNIVCNYIDKVHAQNEEYNERVAQLKGTENIEALLENLDSSKKWNICQSISKIVNELDINSLGNYQSEILKPRNFMAHGIPEVNEDGSLLFKHLGREYIFTEEESVSLRQKLQYYSSKFDEILKYGQQ